LFPNEIQVEASMRTKPHCLVFVFDGSMDEIPNSAEETQFYKEIMNKARERKYYYPQIVLTCIDKVEQKLEAEAKELHGRQLNEFERERKLRETLDMKIEQIVLALGVTRSSVHFVENYKVDSETENE